MSTFKDNFDIKDWIATIFTQITILSCVVFKSYLAVNSSQVGVVLIYLVQLVGLFQWCIRLSCEVENSVSRILIQ